MAALARPTLLFGDEDDEPDYFLMCPRFREAIERIQKKSNPTDAAGIPVKMCALASTSGIVKNHGNTKIYEIGDDRLERVSATIDRTMSYMCSRYNEISHINGIRRYALDPINYKTFADHFYPLLPKHFVRVDEAHLCFFEDDSADSLPHSHVLMEKINGMLFWDYVQRKDISIKERMACIAQAAYILVLVANHGFIHNDPGLYNFIVAPCDEAFEMKGAFLPRSTDSGEGAGAHPGIAQQSINLAFSRGTPRVVLIDYGDSMKLADHPIFPIESQTFIRTVVKYIPADVLYDALDTFKDMGLMFHLPTSMEDAHQITALRETSQSGLIGLIQRLSGIAGGKRRTLRRYRKQKKTLKKRNHK